MNNCHFVGRLASDPTIKDVGNTKLATFVLALEEHRKDKEGNKKKRVDYFEFEAWDSGGTTIAEFCRKGDYLAVDAIARQQKWTTPDGSPRQKVNFRVKSFKMFDSGRHSGHQDNETKQSY